jgi:hypothetical protein
VTLNNGDISVILNGEEIPEDRIEMRDGTVVILDENGNEVRTFDMHFDHNLHGADAMIRILSNPNQNEFRFEAEEPPHVLMGVFMTDPGPAIEKHLGLDPGTTVMISGLYEGLAAHRAGLEEYDLIVSVDGTKPVSQMVIRDLLADKHAGDRVRLEVIQSGRTRTISVDLDAYDEGMFEDAALIGSAPQMDVRTEWNVGNDPMRWLWSPDIRKIQIDPGHRIFIPQWNSFGPNDPLHQGDADVDFDGRADRIDERVEEVQELLDRVLEDVKRQRDGD